MYKKFFKEIRLKDELILFGRDIDIFFSEKILKKYLRLPVWFFTGFISEIYKNFFNSFNNIYIYKEAAIYRYKKSFIGSLIAHINAKEKYMLSFIYDDEKNIDEQRFYIENIIQNLHNVFVSEIPIDQEILPPIIKEIIHNLISDNSTASKLYLKKIIGLDAFDKQIIFHEIHYLFNEERKTGMTIIVGFDF